MKQNPQNQPRLDLQSLVTTMAEKHMNSPLTSAQKSLLTNRLYQLRLKTPDHPPYSAMIQKALLDLSEKGGSSEESISKFIENGYKDLPVAHLTYLKHHLEKLCKSGDVILSRGKYVTAVANQSLKAAVESKELPVKSVLELNGEKQHEKGTKQLDQQRELSLKTKVKINKRPVKRMFKWDYETKQRRVKKLLAQRRNQKKNDKNKVIEKYSELVHENQPVAAEAKEYTKEFVGPKTRTCRKKFEGHGVLSHVLRRSKRFEVEKKTDLSVEPVIAEQKCIEMHGPKSIGRKTMVHKLPVKTIFKWDWERKQRQLKKLLAQDITEKHSDSNEVENGLIQKETKVFSQELVVEVPMKNTCRKRIRGHGLLSQTLRRSKRLRNDFKQEKEVGTKPDFIVEPDLSPICELQRVAGDHDKEVEPDSSQVVEPDYSRITELQKNHTSQNPSQNQEEDVMVKKWEGIKVYRRRNKGEVQERLIVEGSGVFKTQGINDDDDQSLGSWISAKRLWLRQQKLKDSSCNAKVVRTNEPMETTNSLCNGTKKPEELSRIKRLGRPPKHPQISGIIVGLLASNSAKR